MAKLIWTVWDFWLSHEIMIRFLVPTYFFVTENLIKFATNPRRVTDCSLGISHPGDPASYFWCKAARSTLIYIIIRIHEELVKIPPKKALLKIPAF